VLSVYGGRPYEPQVKALRTGVDVVVGTPGRLLDLAEQRYLVLGKVGTLVLDEADEMLDLGFLPDIERILRMVPDQRQTMLFSATMPGPIITLARTFLTQPTHIRAEEPDATAIHERTEQFVYRAHALDKVELLTRVLQGRDRGLTMIFTRTKRTAQRVADDLAERGFAAAPVHGDLGQAAREQALRAFRSGKVDVLVATDVAARGIDVVGVTHVINYQCPEDEKTYIHRIGRTGRAGRAGVAITLVDWDEQVRWRTISDALGLDRPEPQETYSTSEHLFADLGIPAAADGRLPLARRVRAGLDAEEIENLDGGKRSRAPRRGRERVRPGRGRQDGAGDAEQSTRPAREPDGDDATTGPRRKRRRSRAGRALGDQDAEATPTTGENGAGPAGDDSGVARRSGAPATPIAGQDDGPTGDGDRTPAADQADGDEARRRVRRRRGGRSRAGRSGSAAQQPGEPAPVDAQVATG
jgi:superfamily II DNA/RNA helicase